MEVWLFLLGYLIHFLGSMILLRKISKCKSIYGISVDSQICFLLSTISRCLWSHDTRLVETWLAYLELIFSTCISILLVFKMYSYDHTHTKKVPWYFKAKALIPAAAIVAFICHPGNYSFSMQILVAFTIYLEAIALAPQLWLMHRMIEIETMTTHYVGLLAVSRVIRLMFWLTLYTQGDSFIGLFVADALHCVLSADYAVQWFQKIRASSSLLLKR